MARTELDALTNALELAYRSDRFHALLENLKDVRDEEWNTLPSEHSVEVFGPSPELSIADLVRHVGGAKLMASATGKPMISATAVAATAIQSDFQKIPR